MSTTVAIPHLETDRLRLRAMRFEDFGLFAELLTSDRAKFVGGPFTRDQAWRDFAADAGSWVLFGFGYWALEEKASGRFLGTVGLAKPDHFPERELGWLLLAEHEGQGFATEAARAARDHAFRALGWPTLVSYIDPPNARSIAVAERLGAVRDAAAARPDPGDLVYRHSTPEAA